MREMTTTMFIEIRILRETGVDADGNDCSGMS
jgi:hypothetical protein